MENSILIRGAEIAQFAQFTPNQAQAQAQAQEIPRLVEAQEIPRLVEAQEIPRLTPTLERTYCLCYRDREGHPVVVTIHRESNRDDVDDAASMRGTIEAALKRSGATQVCFSQRHSTGIELSTPGASPC